jgi:hypothetical protein
MLLLCLCSACEDITVPLDVSRQARFKQFCDDYKMRLSEKLAECKGGSIEYYERALPIDCMSEAAVFATMTALFDDEAARSCLDATGLVDCRAVESPILPCLQVMAGQLDAGAACLPLECRARSFCERNLGECRGVCATLPTNRTLNCASHVFRLMVTLRARADFTAS